MSLRAEWRLRELTGMDADPFEGVVLSTGLYVDLTGDEDEVQAGIARTLEIEGRLFDRGVTCELKDDGQNCLDCPMYVADRDEEPRAPLCRLGRDQFLLLKRLEEIGFERLMALVEHVGPYMEMGHLDEEYAAVLAHAGY